MHFVLCPKQCNKIEGVVLNRACIKGFFVLNWVRFQSSTSSPTGGRWQKLTKLGSPWEEERSLQRERTSGCDNCDGTTSFVRFCMLSRVLPVHRMRRQIRFARKTKMHDIIFFNFYLFSKQLWFPLPVRFLLLKSLKIFTVRKVLQFSADHHAGWPLCRLWKHRFSVPDLVSFPPAPIAILWNTALCCPRSVW